MIVSNAMRRGERFSLLNQIESVELDSENPRELLYAEALCPGPMARQFLECTLHADPRTQHLVSKARSLYLFDEINEKVIGELDKLTEEFRAAALPVDYSRT